MSAVAQYDVKVQVAGLGDLKALEAYTTKYTAAIKGAQRSSAGFGKALSASTRGQIQNVSFQLQDFAVQLTSGTSATQALGQQLPQLLGAFGAFGVLAGTAAAVLVPLVGSLVNFEGAAGRAKRATEELDAALSSAKSNLDTASKSAKELADSYGLMAPAIKAASDALVEQNKLLAVDKVQEWAAAQLEGTSAGYAGWLAIKDLFGSLSDTFSSTTESAQIVELQVARLRSNFGLTADEASKFGDEALRIFELLARGEFGKAAVDTEQLANQIRALPEASAGAIALLTALEERTKSYGETTQITREQLRLLARDMALSADMSQGTGASLGKQSGSGTTIEQIKKVSSGFKSAVAPISEFNRELTTYTNNLKNVGTPQQVATRQLAEMQAAFDKFKGSLTEEQTQLALQQIADQMQKISDLKFKEQWEGMAAAIDETKTPLMEFAASLQEIANGIAENLAGGLTDAFMSIIDGTKSAKEAFKAFAVDFLKQITAMIIKATLLYTIQSALGAVGGGGGIGGIFSSLLGGGASLYGAGGVGIAPVAAVATPTPFAGGSSASNVVGRIIPATENYSRQSGKSTPLNVTVINNSSAQVKTRKSADGGLTIEVVEEMVAAAMVRGGNKIDRAIQSGYGLRRAGR
jgi:hypothetical protein